MSNPLQLKWERQTLASHLMQLVHDYQLFTLSIMSIAHLCFYLVFINFLCFLVSTGVLEQPRTKHDERIKDGIDTESARVGVSHFEGRKKSFFQSAPNQVLRPEMD